MEQEICPDFGDSVEDAISRIRFAPSSNNLLISSWNSGLRLYDVDGSVLRSEVRTEEALLDCCFVNEDTALTAGSDGCIRRFDLSSETQDIVEICDDSALSIEYSSDTRMIASCTYDNKLIFMDLRKRNSDLIATIVLESAIKSISLSGTNLFAAISNSVYAYDLRNLTTPIGAKQSTNSSGLRCIRAFSNSKGYAIGAYDGLVGIKYSDPIENKENSFIHTPADLQNIIYIFRCHPKSIPGAYYRVSINDIAIHPYDETFITGDNKGYVLVSNYKSRKQLFEFPRYSNSVASLSYNKDGKYLAVASSCTFQEKNESKVAPQIYIRNMENISHLLKPGTQIRDLVGTK